MKNMVTRKRVAMIAVTLIGLYVILTLLGVTGIPSKCYYPAHDVYLCDPFFTLDFWITDRPNSEFGFEYIKIW